MITVINDNSFLFKFIIFVALNIHSKIQYFKYNFFKLKSNKISKILLLFLFLTIPSFLPQFHIIT